MIYYIINGLFIGAVFLFEYRRYKLIQSIKKIDTSIRARYEWTGWHNKLEPNDKWSIFFTLKEVSESNDGSKAQFEVLDIKCEKTSESSISDLEYYKKEFYNRTGGGWLSVNTPTLFYFGESKSIWEERNKKLEALGIK
jgi:hypothetical protein